MGYITFELGSKIWHLETNKKAVIDLIIKLIKYVNDSVGDSTTFEAGHRWRQASKNNAILVFLPGKIQCLKVRKPQKHFFVASILPKKLQKKCPNFGALTYKMSEVKNNKVTVFYQIASN